jgi:1-deoxy-D-xylulose-5-phosphate reductoisomerase
MIEVSILGSTGSIGRNTLDVLARHPERFKVAALTAHRNVTAMVEQCQRWRPRLAVLRDPQAAAELQVALRQAGVATEVASGAEGLVEAATQGDYVMAAIVGAAGLLPTLAAAEAGKRVMLANKEALVMAGSLFMTAIQQAKATLLPIDSEHNALFQCLPPDFQRGLTTVGIERLLLTASGGPFLNTPVEQLAEVTPDQACTHPTWSMGRKISVDSATLMNKGLELIEAHWLFAASPQQLDVVIHPQSVIHSMVRYRDGSVLAQLGQPDMRTPIAHALAWPERIAAGVQPLDFCRLSQLTFQIPDERQFPSLRLARTALAAENGSSAVLNAANEEAVQAFLDRQLRFVDIAAVVEDTLAAVDAPVPASLDDVLALDAAARRQARLYQRQREVSY